MDLSNMVFLDYVRDWLWAPLGTVVLSAVGWHIKSDREARKQHLENIKEIYERIEEEHLRVEDNYVRKDTFETLVKQIETIAEDVKYIRRNRIEEDE